MANLTRANLGWRHRLYLRIYLAVLGSLILAAMIFAWLAHLHVEQPRFMPALDTFAEIAANSLPPASAELKVQQDALDLLQLRVHADLNLYAADGKLIAKAGRTLPLPVNWTPQLSNSAWSEGRPPTFSLKLPDGRWLIGQHMVHDFGPNAGHAMRRPPPPRGLFSVLLVAALAIALGAYPVVRRLTRRLERLQESVDTWGYGQLSTRVAVEGQDEVASLAESFNQAAGRIEALVNAQKNLLANASHELRSPLARIRMALELSTTGNASDTTMQEELRHNIHELDQLIDEILLSSRLDAKQSTPSTVEAIDCIALLAEECARVDAQLEIADDCEEVILIGEAKLVRRMLRNLLENARRYGRSKQQEVSHDAAEILACLRVQHGKIEIDICDRGPGVPESERERIFAPFYRATGAHESDGGVGLGLALVRQIVERHQGQVQCLAREGGGSCFRLCLPEKAV